MTTLVATPDPEDEGPQVPASLEKGEMIMRTATQGTVVSISSSGNGQWTGPVSTGRIVGGPTPPGGVPMRTLEDSMAAHPSAFGGPRAQCSDAELFALAGVARGGRVYVATIGGRHYVGALDDIVMVNYAPVALVMSNLETDLWSPPTWESPRNGIPPGAPDVMRLPWHTVERIEAR